MEMIPITGTTGRKVRIAFTRKSKSPPSQGGRQFDLRGKCLVCEVRPDPLKPGDCLCPPLRARVRALARTREESD